MSPTTADAPPHGVTDAACSPRNGVRRLLVLAAVALLVATIVPGLVVSRHLALNLGLQRTETFTAADALAWDGNGPRRGTLTVSRTVATAPTDVDSVANVTSRSALSLNGDWLATLNDAVDLNRESTYPQGTEVDQQTLTVTGHSFDLGGHDANREGLRYFFPAKAEKRSYAFFDAITQDSQPLDFVRTEKVAAGGKVASAYVFYQSLPATPLPAQVTAALPKAQLKGKADDFYTAAELNTLGLKAGSAVVLDPFYSIERTVWIEPTSGIILDEEANIRMLYATDAAQASASLSSPPDRRALLVADLRWDDASRSDAVARASEITRLHQYMAAVGWAGKALAVALAGAAAWTYQRRRHV